MLKGTKNGVTVFSMADLVILYIDTLFYFTVLTRPFGRWSYFWARIQR